MNKQDLQKELPKGLLLEQELTAVMPTGQFFSANDHRLHDHSPVQRRIYFIEFNSTENWEDAWEEQLTTRLHRLSSTPTRFITHPFEAGLIHQGKILYVVNDYLTSNLAEQISQESWNVTQPSKRLKVFEKIVNGLHELHQLKIAHGGFYPKNIAILESDNDTSPICQITNVEWGPLLNWAKGNVVENEAKDYYPPEWEGKPQTPTFEADLYALGVIGCKMFLGKEAYSPPSNIDQLEILRDHLKQQNTPSHIRELLCTLLSPDPALRPKNITEVRTLVKQGSWKDLGEIALQKFRRLSTLECGLVVGIPLLLFLISGYLLGSRHSGTVSDLNGQVASLQAKQKTLEENFQSSELNNETLRKTKGDLQSEISKAKESISSLEKTIKSLKEKLKEHKIPVPKSPPSPHLLKQYESIALTEAVKIWDEFASKPNLSFKDFKMQTANAIKRLAFNKIWDKSGKEHATKEVTRLFEGWISKFDKQSDKSWTIELIEGKDEGEKNFETERIFTIYSGERSKVDYTEWDDKKSHKYQNKSIKFHWVTGEEIGIMLEEDGNFSNPNMISGVKGVQDDPVNFKGPVAVWKLHMKQIIKDDNTNVSLEINVANCPGPTRAEYEFIKGKNSGIKKVINVFNK